jgi:branched-subunit amino acid transport protein
MMIWVAIVVTGLLTYALRISLIGLVGKRDIPASFRQVLRFVPVTVLPAIIGQELLLQDGTPDVSLQNVRLLAGVAAILVAWYTKNTVLTIVVGMGVLWLLQAAVSA